MVDAGVIDPLQFDRLVIGIAVENGAPRGPAVRDSEQYADGWVGLMLAVRRFDPSRGAEFIDFAAPYVRGTIWNGKVRRRGPGWRRKSKEPGPRMLSFGRADADEGFRAAAVADHRSGPDVDARDQAEFLLRFLDTRSRRLVVRVMEGMSIAAAGRAEEAPISQPTASHVIGRALDRMRAVGR